MSLSISPSEFSYIEQAIRDHEQRFLDLEMEEEAKREGETMWTESIKMFGRFDTECQTSLDWNRRVALECERESKRGISYEDVLPALSECDLFFDDFELNDCIVDNSEVEQSPSNDNAMDDAAEDDGSSGRFLPFYTGSQWGPTLDRISEVGDENDLVPGSPSENSSSGFWTSSAPSTPRTTPINSPLPHISSSICSSKLFNTNSHTSSFGRQNKPPNSVIETSILKTTAKSKPSRNQTSLPGLQEEKDVPALTAMMWNINLWALNNCEHNDHTLEVESNGIMRL